MTSVDLKAAEVQVPLNTPYRIWQHEEGIPIYRGSYLQDLYQLPLAPWARAGQPAAFINLAGQEEDDAFVLEIAPGGKTEPLHHLFEEMIFVLEGRGATTFWSAASGASSGAVSGNNPETSTSGGRSADSSRKQTVEWQRGSLFSPPINCYYQHFNLDGDRPLRLFAITNAPMLMNIFRSPEFIFGDTFPFSDRYDAADDYFRDRGHFSRRNMWKTNFVPDLRSFELEEDGNRVPGDLSMMFHLANNQMRCHVSEFGTGLYKRAHRHGPGAHLIVLTGEGYSLLWIGGEAPRKVDWQDGAVISPAGGEFHQHFNTGPTPARYLALRPGELDPRRRQGLDYDESEIDGIRYEDEDPAIYDRYVVECARHGAKVELPRPNYGS